MAVFWLLYSLVRQVGSNLSKKKDYGMVHFVMFDTETDLGKGLIGPEEFGGRQLLNNGLFGTENQQISFLNADLLTAKSPVCICALSFLSLLFVNWEGTLADKPSLSLTQTA